LTRGERNRGALTLPATSRHENAPSLLENPYSGLPSDPPDGEQRDPRRTIGPAPARIVALNHARAGFDWTA
jgi:hypothetical protein